MIVFKSNQQSLHISLQFSISVGYEKERHVRTVLPNPTTGALSLDNVFWRNERGALYK